MQDDWFSSPKSWEAYLQTATLLDLEELEEKLPYNDAGNYRRVCLAVERGDFQVALELLETGGSYFDVDNFAAGLHAFVRQRLGLKLTFAGPRQGDALAKEDTIYWYLAWSLHHAELEEWEEATRWLEEASNLASELKLVRALNLLKTIRVNLKKSGFGLPLVAPPSSVLASAKAFDDLRQHSSRFERLAALKNLGYLDRLERCRLAQYLLYHKYYEEALNLVEHASPRNFLLAYAIRMKLLECLERFEELGEMVERFKPGSSESLEAEATILAYESCAFYFAVVRKEPKVAYAYLHRAEALAIEHKLTYRLGVIRTLLEATANMAGDTLTLDPLLSTSGLLKHMNIRVRYDSFLRAGNIQAIEELVNQSLISKEDFYLASATLEYNRFLSGEGKINVVAGLIANQEPDDPISRFYWSLLMLQVFNHMGEAEGRANPERIQKFLAAALKDSDHIDTSLGVVTHLYPLGLALASYLHTRLEDRHHKVATVWCEDTRDGLRRDGKKIAIITKPVREALVLDDLHATRDHFTSVTSTKTGHQENRARLERSLVKVKLKRSEITSVGGVYRGVLRLGKTLEHRKLLQHSDVLLKSSQFLRDHLSGHALEFNS